MSCKPRIAVQDTLTGAAFYSGLYRRDLQWQVQWLLAGATNKALAVKRLVRESEIDVRRICELGCGTGAVLQRCRELGIGSEWYGVDYSADGVSYLSTTQPEVRTAVADITVGCTFPGTHFDLLLLSHVLEHLESPADLLQSLSKWSYSYLLVEVPLENLPLLRLKCKLFGRNHSAGHVQFYDARSFRDLLTVAGFKIVREYWYAPVIPIRVLRRMFKTKGFSYLTCMTKLLTGHLLPRLFGRFWKRWYYGHYAVLCSVK